MTDERKKELLKYCDEVINSTRPSIIVNKEAQAIARALKAELSRPESPPLERTLAEDVITHMEQGDVVWAGTRRSKITPRVILGAGLEDLTDAKLEELSKLGDKRPEAPLPEVVREIEKQHAAAEETRPSKFLHNSKADWLDRHAYRMHDDRATLLRFIKSRPPRLTEDERGLVEANRNWVPGLIAIIDRLSQGEAPAAWTLERQAALSKRLKEWFPHYRDAMELVRDAAADIGRDFCKQAEAPPAVTVEEIAQALWGTGHPLAKARETALRDPGLSASIVDTYQDARRIAALLRSRGVNVGGE